MSNFVIQGYANLENVNANNMDLFYATMSAQLSTFFPILSPAAGSICNGVGNIINKYGQVGTSNVFNFASGAIRFLDQVTNLTTDISIKPCYANYTGATVTVTCPISATQYYVVAVLSFNTPTDPFTTSTSVIISPTAMTLAQIAAQTTPSLYNPIFAITTTDGTNYTIHLDNNCAFNYGFTIETQFPDVIDVGGLVSIIGPNGLSITNSLAVTGSSVFTGNAQFNSGLGAFGTIVFNEVSTRGGIVTFATTGTMAYLGSNNTSSGGFNGFKFDDTIGRALLNNPSATITSPFETVCFNDLQIVQLFSVTDTGGNSWFLLCQSFSGSFPSSCFSIIGNSTYSFPGGSFNATIDLGTAGIASTNATLGIFAVTSKQNYASNLSQLSIQNGTGSTLLTILTDGVPGLGTDNIQFQLIYK